MKGIKHLNVIIHRHILIAGNSHLLTLSCLSPNPLVIKVFWQGEGDILVGMKVLQFGQPIAMAGLLVEQQKEGAVGLTLLIHPGDGLVRQEIGEITLLNMRFPVHGDERGIVVITLTGNNLVMIKARGCADQMPFTYDSRGITRLLHQFGHGLLTAVKDAVLVVRKPILVAVLTCDHTGTTRAGERVGHKTVDKPHSVLSNTVQIGGLYITMIVARHHLCRMVISHDIQDVRSLLCPCTGMESHDGQRKKTERKTHALNVMVGSK